MQWYKQYKSFQYIIHIWWLIYLLLAILVLILGILNNSSVYTWFKNPSAPGSSLTSYRGTFNDVTIRMAIFAHIFILCIVQCMIFFGDHNGLFIFWFTSFLLMFLLTFLSIIGLGSFYSTCNQQNQYGNMCNSVNYCNVNEIRANPANYCPDPTPSATPVLLQSLTPNPNFMALFWINFVLFVFQMIFVAVLGYYWYISTKNQQPREEEEETTEKDLQELPEQEKQLEQEIVQMPAIFEENVLRSSKVIFNSNKKTRVHSLKKRN